jgi:hypothetical protein
VQIFTTTELPVGLPRSSLQTNLTVSAETADSAYTGNTKKIKKRTEINFLISVKEPFW